MVRLDDDCKWVLTWKGKNIELGSGLDSDLDYFLLQHINDFKKLGPLDLYSKATDIVDEAISQLSTDVKNAQVVRKRHTTVDGDDVEEVETYVAIPHSIGITRALGSLKIHNGGVLVTGMSTDEWRNNKIQELSNKVKESDATDPTGKIKLIDYMKANSKSATQMVDMEENSWGILTDLGTEVHAVFESVFKDNSPKRDKLPEEVFNDLVSQVKDFKSYLEEKYPGCKFYPELAIKSKNLSADVRAALSGGGYDSINGIIDLLVIDANGRGHLFDYKVSRKNIAPESKNIYEWWETKGNIDLRKEKLWVSSKKLAATYQTEFYKQMLAQYGINVVDTNIFPVKLNLKYDNKNNPFEVTGVAGIDLNLKRSGDKVTGLTVIKNPGSLGDSGYNYTVKTYFESQSDIDSEDIKKISEAYDIFFPKNSYISRKEDMRTKVEWYKKQDKYVHKLLPGEYYYGKEGKEYRISFPTQRSIYCKEDEIDIKVQEFINKQASAQSTKFLEFAHAVTEAKKEGKGVEELVKLVGPNAKAFVSQVFEHYMTSDWVFEEDETLNSIGLLRFKKGNKCEIICLSTDALRAELSDANYKLPNTEKSWRGTSILGKKLTDKEVDFRVILPAMTYSMELMKAMTYVSIHPEFFSNMRIAEIKVINPWSGMMESALNTQLLENFNELVSKNPGCGIKQVNSKLFMNDAESLVEAAREWSDTVSEKIGDSGDENYLTQQWFESKIDLIEQQCGSELDLRKGYQATPIWNAYVKLKEGLNAIQHHYAHTEGDKADIIQKGKVFELNGLMVSSPQLSSSTNIRELADIIDQYAQEVRNQVVILGTPFKAALDKVYKKYGTGAKVFNSWFADKEALKLKDPDSSDFIGDPESREALRCFLETMAKLRHPDIDLSAAKELDDYYYIPLMEAVFSRQVKGVGLWQTLKNKWKEKFTVTEGLFMGEDPDSSHESISGYVMDNQELYNKLKFDNLDARADRLRKYGGPGMFETDLELVMNASLVGFCRANLSKEYIPKISGLKVVLQYKDAYGSTKNSAKMANIQKRFDDVVKNKFYGESIIAPELQPLAAFLNVIKSGFTTMTLAINNRSFLRESLQGILTGLSRAGVKLYPGINEKSYIEGLEYVIQESWKNFSSVSLLQQMNALYGMANQSLSQLAGQRRLNWAHINHWGKDTLFLTATSPDFMHRMALLVAKMKSDNCFDAHSLGANGELIYDWTKDKRFEHFVKGDTTNPNYLKEESLYKAMIDDFNAAGFRNADGSLLSAEKRDALPQAYTRTEAQGLKNYADFLYGHYDNESKSLVCDTLFGVVFLQFKTYLTAKVEQWTIHKGQYNIAKLEQQFDDNGKPLYVKFYEDEEGVAHKETLLESEYESLSEEEKAMCRLQFDYTRLPLQGMLQETLSVIHKVLTMDTEGLKKIWEDPITRAQFKLQLNDMWVMMFLSLLVTFIFGKSLDVDKPFNSAEVYKEVKKMGPLKNLTYNVLSGALTDSQLQNILGSFTSKPPILSSAQRFISSSANVLTGDISMVNWMTKNFGVIRDFEGIAETMDDKYR